MNATSRTSTHQCGVACPPNGCGDSVCSGLLVGYGTQQGLYALPSRPVEKLWANRQQRCTGTGPCDVAGRPRPAAWQRVVSAVFDAKRFGRVLPSLWTIPRSPPSQKRQGLSRRQHGALRAHQRRRRPQATTVATPSPPPMARCARPYRGVLSGPSRGGGQELGPSRRRRPVWTSQVRTLRVCPPRPGPGRRDDAATPARASPSE